MEPPAPPALSVVVPAYNEAARIGPTLERICGHLGGAAFELWVVDDGSGDGTAAVVEAAARAHPQIRLLRCEPNHGKGYAVRRGVEASAGARVLVTDADLSTPIEELARLEAALDAGADVAIGSRAVPGARIERRQPLHRVLMGRVFNLVLRWTLMPLFRDTQCGFKLFRGDAAHDLFARLTLDGFAFDVEALYLALRLGYRVAEVPVIWRDDPNSRVRPVRDSWAVLADLWRIRRRHARAAQGAKTSFSPR
jgi:dolichyl-phosphate beta-glucosyltransferase